MPPRAKPWTPIPHGSKRDESITMFKGGDGISWRKFFRQLCNGSGGSVANARVSESPSPSDLVWSLSPAF